MQLMTRAQPQKPAESTGATLLSRVLNVGVLLGIFWALEIIDHLIFDQGLNQYGIRPRDMDGLIGIFLSPFLHGDFGHLSANSLPFLVLGVLVALRGNVQFWLTTGFITVAGGLLVWLTAGGNSVHIGASGVIFGYLGFLLFAGIFERSVTGILVAVGVGVAYGGLIWGVLPGTPGVSWQGHLFGFLAGIAAAKIVTDRFKKKKAQAA